MLSNGILINVQKTQLMKFCTKQSNHGLIEATLGNVVIKESSHVKFLGLLIDTNLNWSVHMSNITSKLSSVSGILFKLKNKIEKETKLIIYRSLAESVILYMNIIWAWTKCKNLKKVQVCQNRLLKCVFNLPIRFPTTELYKLKKGVIDICNINKFQRCLYIFKCLKFPFPGQVTPERTSHGHNTRFRDRPRTTATKRVLLRQRITTQGVELYNHLEDEIIDSQSIAIFKNKMYIHLQGALD